MKFSIRFADKIVGTLVVLALAIVVVVVFMLGRSQRWFARDYQYITYLTSASGISTNMAVQFKGFTIGHVKRIRLAEDDSVEVIFTIFEEHNHRVTAGSVVELQSSPIPGFGNAFVFYPGKGREELVEGAVIPEINSTQATQLIAMGLADVPETHDSISNIINMVASILETVNMSLAGTNGSENPPIAQILANIVDATANISTVTQNLSEQLEPIFVNVEAITGDLMDQISPILSNVETITDQLAAPTGTVMAILDAEGPVFAGIAEVLESITGIMGSIEKTMDFVPAQLPQISILLSDLHSALTEAEKLIIALTNNPLLRGGIPELRETGPGAAAVRDMEF